MQMIPIKVDDKLYEIPEAVAKRMEEYYKASAHAINAYNRLSEQAAKVRNLQKKYFTKRDSFILRASKTAEAELDDMLAGKSKKEENRQQELFR